MLKQRIITAAWLAPLVLVGLFGLDGGAFALFTALMVLLATWEWANLAGADADHVADRGGHIDMAAVALRRWLAGEPLLGNPLPCCRWPVAGHGAAVGDGPMGAVALLGGL